MDNLFWAHVDNTLPGLLPKRSYSAFKKAGMQTDLLERPVNPELPGAEDLLQLKAAALEAAANPILISSRDGTIIWVNEAFGRLSGYTGDEALGKSTSLLKSGHQSASVFKSM